MKEGISTTVNLSLLFYFMLLVAGFALFGTNYYRAFALKNQLTTYTEQFEGNFNNITFKTKRIEAINRLGYKTNIQAANIDSWNCPQGEGWCYKLTSSSPPDDKRKEYRCIYEIKTFVNTDIPVINKIFSRFFEVNGETKEIKRSGSCNE